MSTKTLPFQFLTATLLFFDISATTMSSSPDSEGPSSPAAWRLAAGSPPPPPPPKRFFPFPHILLSRALGSRTGRPPTPNSSRLKGAPLEVGDADGAHWEWIFFSANALDEMTNEAMRPGRNQVQTEKNTCSSNS
uniref:Uncharacterized protein n=1 Tax=Arundo donax TaxID=35708 RepID=A0A0A8XZS8_ARUDO